MNNRIKKPLLVLLGLVALAAGGAGAAQAVGGGEQEGSEGSERADGGNLKGGDAQQAERAAVRAAGGGRVVESERGDDGDAAYEVAVRKSDGSVVELHLDRNFKITGTENE